MVATNRQYSQNKIPPQKFALWVGIAGIIMMFAAFTSAYVVRRASGNWYEFKLPNIFFVSTAIMLASSITIQASFAAFKKGQEKLYKVLLLATFALGLAFVCTQYMGWQAMDAIGATFTINPSSSFIYVISGRNDGGGGSGYARLYIAFQPDASPSATI
jgi:cytochrome c oxidase subunit 3